MLVVTIQVGFLLALEIISSGYASEHSEILVPLSPSKVRQIDRKEHTAKKSGRSDTPAELHRIVVNQPDDPSSSETDSTSPVTIGSWQILEKHDVAGGIVRVSGDGPKMADIADPTVDIGFEDLATAEMILTHPNYVYLPHLSECGIASMADEQESDIPDWDNDDDEESGSDEVINDEEGSDPESKEIQLPLPTTAPVVPLSDPGKSPQPQKPAIVQKPVTRPVVKPNEPLITENPSSAVKSNVPRPVLPNLSESIPNASLPTPQTVSANISKYVNEEKADKDSGGAISAVKDTKGLPPNKQGPTPVKPIIPFRLKDTTFVDYKTEKVDPKIKRREETKKVGKSKTEKTLNQKNIDGNESDLDQTSKVQENGGTKMTPEELKLYIEKNYIGTTFSDDDLESLSDNAYAEGVDKLILRYIGNKKSTSPLAVKIKNQVTPEDELSEVVQSKGSAHINPTKSTKFTSQAKVKPQTRSQSRNKLSFKSLKSKSNRRKRIVGGNVVRHQKHPWMVQLYLYNVTSGEHTFHCAGTLITNSTVLTAAHCLTRFGPGMTLDVAVIGNTDRRDIVFCTTSNPAENCSRSLIRYIEDFEVHDAYNEGNLNHDIALIYLKKPITLNDNARPICLPFMKNLFEGWTDVKLTGVGWGATNKFANSVNYLSEILKEVQFDLQPRTLCDKFHMRIYGRVLGDRICTGGNTGRASCNGDSGGAVVKELNIPETSNGAITRVFQLGIVSAGGHPVDTCGFQGRPSIDTNVFYFMEWILNHITPGVPSYHYVDQTGASSDLAWILKDPTAADDSDSEDPGKSGYVNEFSTGKHVDVTEHPNVGQLPPFDECGSLPKPAKVPDEEKPPEKDDDDHMNQVHIDVVGSGINKTVLRRKRIVGGVPITAESFYPWMAQIFVRNVETDETSLRCSGSIISKTYILTAAHCVTEIAPPYVFDSIVVGQYNRNKSQECFDGKCYSPITVKISHIMIHSDYEKYTHKNNIALVKLSQDLHFTRMVHPICLPRREKLVEGIRTQRYFTVGWGRVQRDGFQEDDLSKVLLQMYVEPQPREDCNFVYSRTIDVLDRSRVCAGGRPGQGECLGDGGSPLMKKFQLAPDHPITGKIFALGLVSFADCGMQGMPTVYTNVLYYMDWILDNLVGSN